MENKIITNFPVTVYGKMERFSDTITRGRCRVFYKGHNRNGTYISDAFAQKLIDSAIYAPIKGIYNDSERDFTDHGAKRNEGRIYGIIPADHNFAWEEHQDVDGKTRTYACFDVLYYTALYVEAAEIAGKGQSMELYRNSLKGKWQVIEGKKAYVFEEGCFLGLQALGDEVEPCFEGAEFYQKESNIIALLEKYEKRTDIFQNHEQGGKEMPSINFKISDGQKYEYLFRLLNPNFCEEGGWTIENVICDVYDEYALINNIEQNIFERVYYTKNDETDSVEIGERIRCYLLDITESEKAILDGLRESVGTYENIQNTINEHVSTIATLTEENSTKGIKIEELDNTIATLTIERDEAVTAKEGHEATITELNSRIEELGGTINSLNENIQQKNASITSLTEERDALASYRREVENAAKRDVINQYTENLSEEVLQTYMNNLDNYTVEDLDKELTYELKKANPSLFSKTPVQTKTPKLPKDDGDLGGISSILSKYERQ